jgi:hypothetical protein
MVETLHVCIWHGNTHISSFFLFFSFLLDSWPYAYPAQWYMIPYAPCNAHPSQGGRRGGGFEALALATTLQHRTIHSLPARPTSLIRPARPVAHGPRPDLSVRSQWLEIVKGTLVGRNACESVIFVPENREKQSRRDPAGAGWEGEDLFRYIKDNIVEFPAISKATSPARSFVRT